MIGRSKQRRSATTRSRPLPNWAAVVVMAMLAACLAQGAASGARVDPCRWFSAQEIERAESFHERGLWLAAASLMAKIALLAALYVWREPVRRALRLRASGRWYLQAAAWALVAGVLLALVSVAAGAVEYRRHLAVGLTQQPVQSWLLDMAKLRVRGVTMTVLVAVGVYGCIGLLGRRSWCVGAFALLMTIRICSTLLMAGRTSTLLYEYAPLEPGALRSHVESLIARSGQDVLGITVARTSRISTRANAWIALFGKERRLVLTDTLIAQYTPEEIGVIAAHELGHVREWIFAKRMARSALRVLLGLGVAHVFFALAARRAMSRFGSSETLPLYLAAMVVSGFLWGPIGNQWTKRSEVSANRYALDLTQAPNAFISVQKRMAVDNLSYIHPPYLVRLLFLDHPSPPEAIAEAEKWVRVSLRPDQP